MHLYTPLIVSFPFLARKEARGMVEMVFQRPARVNPVMNART